MKIYLVTVSAGIHEKHVEQQHLIRAKTKAGAIAFVAAKHLDGRLPDQDELVRAVTSGVKIEDSTTP